MLPKLTVVLGGAASGKSVWAENLLLSSGLDPVYLATSRILDDEIKLRVETHKSRRCEQWMNIEAQIDLLPVLVERQTNQGVLMDCATMWLSNVMMDDLNIKEQQCRMLDAFAACPAHIIVVTNEVGQGIVPDNALARQFREAQGRLNIALAEQADLAVLVTAGLPLVLKGTLP